MAHFLGAIIRGRGIFSTFKVINLTYHAHTKFIEFIAIAIAFAHST